MNLRFYLSGVAILLLSGFLAGCNPYPLPGPLVYGKCGIEAHTEAYPHAQEERRAYGCKSDEDGFLEGAAQGDRRAN